MVLSMLCVVSAVENCILVACEILDAVISVRADHASVDFSPGKNLALVRLRPSCLDINSLCLV